MLDYIRREPARVTGFVLATIALATAFGLTLTEQQAGAIVGFVGAALVLLGGEVTRSQVTPVHGGRRRRPPEHGATRVDDALAVSSALACVAFMVLAVARVLGAW